MMSPDNAELEIEDTNPEVEALMAVVFEDDEKRKVVTQRKSHENKHRHKAATKESLSMFINFELRFLRIIHLRQQKVALNNPHVKGRVLLLEMYIKKRLNRLFLAGMRIFSEELKIWICYLRFCKQNNMYSDGSQVLKQMLLKHGSMNHELYLLAATWETEYCRNLDKARVYLMMGIHQHPNDKDILRTAFKLELKDTAQKRKECADNNEPLNLANPLLTTANAELIFDNFIKKLGDVDMMNELLKLSTSYDFTENLYKKINDAIFERKNDERTWNIIAQRELNDSSADVTPKDQIKQCVALYDKAVKLLNTPLMWGFYLDALLELIKDLSTFPNYKRKLLLSAFQRCANNKKMSEKYYLLWVGYLQGTDKHKKLVEMLNQAVKSNPDSVKLWSTLLITHINKNEDKQANAVFDLGVNVLGNKGLPLWKLMLEFEVLKKKNKVERLYKRGIEMAHCPLVSQALKPMYLEWLVFSQSIVAARNAYDQQIGLEPYSLEMHLKMVYLEKLQSVVNIKRVRMCYTYATYEFPKNLDVWVEFCKFLMEYETSDKLNDLIAHAAKNLDPHQFDALRVEMHMSQTVPTLALFTDTKMRNDNMMEM